MESTARLHSAPIKPHPAGAVGHEFARARDVHTRWKSDGRCVRKCSSGESGNQNGKSADTHIAGRATVSRKRRWVTETGSITQVEEVRVQGSFWGLGS